MKNDAFLFLMTTSAGSGCKKRGYKGSFIHVCYVFLCTYVKDLRPNNRPLNNTLSDEPVETEIGRYNSLAFVCTYLPIYCSLELHCKGNLVAKGKGGWLIVNLLLIVW